MYGLTNHYLSWTSDPTLRKNRQIDQTSANLTFLFENVNVTKELGLCDDDISIKITTLFNTKNEHRSETKGGYDLRLELRASLNTCEIERL